MPGQSNNDTWHGTLSGYGRHKCRCKACQAAKASYSTRWRKLNPDKVRASSVRWRKFHPDKEKANQARRHKLNPGRRRASYARWAKLNPEKKKASVARWRQLNPEKKKAANAKYQQTDNGKQVHRLNWHRRRARKINAAGFCTKEQLDARIAFYGWLCWMCRAPYEAIDHVIPLARDGSNWPANLRPACKSCNSSKGAGYAHPPRKVVA